MPALQRSPHLELGEERLSLASVDHALPLGQAGLKLLLSSSGPGGVTVARDLLEWPFKTAFGYILIFMVHGGATISSRHYVTSYRQRPKVTRPSEPVLSCTVDAGGETEAS